MLVSSLAALLLPALALAAPAKRTYGHEEKVEESHHDDHHDDTHKLISAFPFEFTSTFSAKLSPDFIINANQTSVPGLAGGYGMAKFGINAVDDLICFHIEAYISGNYSSPARTATHIVSHTLSAQPPPPLSADQLPSSFQHEAPFGRSGPPRLAFPNPTGDSPINEFGRRVSAGCMMGPFTTGIVANGGAQSPSPSSRRTSS